MRHRQPLPRLWLMTDERTDALLEAALARLPRGAGIIFRHHATPPPARRARYEAVRRIARRRRLTLVLAGPPRLAVAWRADGAHGRSPQPCPAHLIRTFPAHDRAALIAAARCRADLALLSPVFATRSHPGAGSLGPKRFGLLASASACPVIALGGMDARRYRGLRALGASGWAAIDGLGPPSADQKRKEVPR